MAETHAEEQTHAEDQRDAETGGREDELEMVVVGRKEVLSVEDDGEERSHTKRPNETSRATGRVLVVRT